MSRNSWRRSIAVLLVLMPMARTAGAEPPKLTRPPVVKTSALPVYPQRFLDSGRVVTVVLTLELSASGEVVRAIPVGTDEPEFAEAAVLAALKLEFYPAEIDGRPRAIRFTYPMTVAPPPPRTEPEASVAARSPRNRRDGTGRGVTEIVARSRKETPVPGSTTALIDAHARAIPGAMGDGLAIVQSLPGIARPQAGSSQVIVWGAAPAETRIYVDDVPIPFLYHRGGLRSVISSPLVTSVELVPAGFGAAYGRATGGLLRLKTTLAPPEGVHGQATLDPLDASTALSYRQSDTGGPWALAAGGRYGFFDRVLPLIAKDVTFPVAAYADFSTKVIHRDDNGTTDATVLGAIDSIDRRVPEPRGVKEQSDRTDTHFVRLALRHAWSASTILAWLGRDVDDATLAFGNAGARQRSESLRTGLRATRSITLAPTWTLRLGADVELSRHDVERTGTLSLPAREGDGVVFGQAPTRRMASDVWVNHFVGMAPYAEVEWTPTSRWLIAPGARLETMVLEGTRLLPQARGGVDVGYSRLEAYPDPRLRAEYRASRSVSVGGACGLYHQEPDPLDMSAVFGSPSLSPSRGAHVLTGTRWQPAKSLAVEWSVFARYLSDLTSRTTLDSPPLSENLTSMGEGRSLGAAVTARVRGGKVFSGWINYTLTRSERRDTAHGPWRSFDFEQPHFLTAVASVEPMEGWTLGTRLRASSGYPRARIVGAYYDAQAGVFQPIRDGRERLPPTVQLDLHAARNGRWGPIGWSLYLDVINVLNLRNAEEAVYSHDYRERGYLSGFPLLALLGARIER